MAGRGTGATVAALLTGVTLLGAAARPASARPPQCLSGPVDCVDEPCSLFQDCLDALPDIFQQCVNSIQSAPRKCALILDEVQRCRDQRTALRNDCIDELRANIKCQCSDVLIDGFDLDKCEKGNRKKACRISRGAARRACQGGAALAPAAITPLGGAATTTTVITATTTTMPVSCAAVEDPFRCQARCVSSIVHGCYDECTDRCEGDQTALKICRRICRDEQCNTLGKTCIADDGDGGGGAAKNAYLVCCTSHDSCLAELSCDLVCEQLTTTTVTTTLTTTTVTATSTSTTSTTSTTLF